MLSQPDFQFVKRNKRLPGLRFLFDTNAFSDYVEKVVPDLSIEKGTPGYVRYKPNTKCLVGYRAMYKGVESYLYATTYARHCLSKLRGEKSSFSEDRVSGTKRVLVNKFSSVVSIFPFDRKLTSLHRLAGGEQREKLIKELLPERNQGESITIQGLRYKPETLFVAKLINKASGDTEGLVKFYREYDYLHAKRAAEIFGSKGSLVIPKLLVSSEKNHALVFGWEAGRPLDEAIYQKEFDATTLKRVAKALREIHQQKPQAVEQVQPTREAETLTEAASVLSVISPSLGSKAALVARKLAHLLSQKRPVYSPVHGDFYPGQVLVSPEEKITIVDFDRAILADPARDPGTFCAHLERDFINGRLAYSKMVTLKENLIEGYLEDIEEELDIRVRIQLYTAAELFRLAREPFRTREKDWTKSTEFLLCRAEMFIEDLLPRSITPQKGAGVPVTYPFEIKKNQHFSMLHDALTPEIVENGLKEGMNQTLNDPRILAIRVIRYKLLRRCLIEYDVLESGSSGFSKPVTLIGKIRCRGLDIRPYLVQNQLWTRSFGPESKDNFLVPEPLGIIPDLHMLVYKKVDGIPATKLLSSERGDIVARQAARAAFKIHNCSVSPHRVHTVSDEMKILIDKLPTVAKEVPELKNRIQSILHVAAKLAASIAKPVLRPVHRNFYSDKILIGEKNTHVLDFDLFCLGDPALDIGNFIGHVIEQSLRTFGNPEALSRASNAIRDEYLKISGQSSARSIDAYTLLTLVRHIYISTLFQERRHFTETLLEFCERECHEFLRWPNPVNKGSRR